MNKNEKEIKINGVDVSECGFYDYEFGECNEGHIFNFIGKCENNPFCYYKQLQREKVQYDKLVKQNKSLQTENKKLVKDNNVLRKTLKEIEGIAEDRSLYCENCSNVMLSQTGVKTND